MLHALVSPRCAIAILAIATTAAAQDALAGVAGGGASTTSSSSLTAQLGPNRSGPYSLQIVFVNTPGHPTNVIPGLGLPFNPGGGSTAAFERPIYSPIGLHWGINVIADLPTTTDDDVLLVDNVVVLREGSPTPWASGGQNVGTISPSFGLNDLGDLLVGNNVAPATTADDYLALFQGGVWNVLAQEGQSVTSVLPALTGGLWASAIDSPSLTNSTIPAWRATGITGLAGGTANNAVLVLGPGLALQKGIDVPSNQGAGGAQPWENFGVDDLHQSGDGVNYLIAGDLLGATTSDNVVVVNGAVVVQEGFVLPGSSFVEPVDLTGIVESWMDKAGNWYVRGNNDVTETDWVYRNGVVVADSAGASEVVPGSGEFFDDTDFADCFFAFDGNSSGQFVIGGVTNAASTANGVLVFDNGQGFRRVLVREGDGIDLDGNGLLDDDRFFATFGNDDVVLLEDGTVVFTATLRNGAGTAVDQGVFRLEPRAASCTLRNGTGISPIACTCATLPVLGTTWTIDVSFGPTTVATAAFVATAPAGPFPIFGGELLIDPVTAAQIPGNGQHPIPLPLNVQFLGLQFFAQALRLDLNGANLDLQITNAQDAVVGL